MPKNSRKPAGGASSSTSSHQEAPTPPQLSEDLIKEKNELLEAFEEQIKVMKKESEDQEEELSTLIFLSTVISTILHAVSFALRIPTLIPSSNIATRIPAIMEIEASRVFKEMHRIISETIIGIKPDAKGSIKIWRRRCRKNVEKFEMMIKEEDYKDKLRIKVLNVIVMTLMPELGKIREASTCSCCKMINWKHKDKVLAKTSGKLEVLEKDFVRRLSEAVIDTIADS